MKNFIYSYLIFCYIRDLSILFNYLFDKRMKKTLMNSCGN